jgi:LysM repeat protein
MSTPNPLIPQGSFQSQASKGASNVRIAVATIVAIHLVFFGGLLLQGCKRDAKVAGNASDTNSATNLTLPPINTESLYYTNATNLPSEASNGVAQARGNNAMLNEAPATANTAAAPRDAWQSNNLGNVAAAGTPETGAGATKEYTVLRGDSFARIAKRHGTTVGALKNANPNIDPAKLRAGSKINIPVSAANETTATAPATATATGTGAVNSVPGESSGAAAGSSTYTVKSGDTLTHIAKAHGVTVSQIRSANHLKTSRVNVGQKLKIPAAGEGGAKSSSTNHSRHHAAKTAPVESSATSTNVP